MICKIYHFFLSSPCTQQFSLVQIEGYWEPGAHSQPWYGITGRSRNLTHWLYPWCDSPSFSSCVGPRAALSHRWQCLQHVTSLLLKDATEHGTLSILALVGVDRATTRKELLRLKTSDLPDAFWGNKNTGQPSPFSRPQCWVFNSGSSCLVEILCSPYFLTQMRQNRCLKSKWNRMGLTNPHEMRWEDSSGSPTACWADQTRDVPVVDFWSWPRKSCCH